MHALVLTSDGTGNGVLESPQKGHGDVRIEHFQIVLVGALDAVEFVGVLVNAGRRVHVWEGYLELRASLHDRPRKDDVADDGTDSGAQDDVAVFVGNGE